MTPEAILTDLLESSIKPNVTPDQCGIVVPAGTLSAAQRYAMLTHIPDLITYLLESSGITRPLLAAAMRQCDQFNDTEKALQDMCQQMLETQTLLQQDLLDDLRVAPAQPHLIAEKTMRK